MSAAEGGQPPLSGQPGGSAQREWQRRRRNRESRVRAKHPRIGGLLLRLGEAPQHETAWARGAAGEARVAAALAKHCKPDVLFLHDRRVPGSRANIDHLAIARSGVWVIDAKHYTGRVAIEKHLFGRARLRIGGRDKTKLIEGLGRQVELVKAAIDEDGDCAALPVRGALCFVEAELPMFRSLSFDGYHLGYPRAIARTIDRGRAAVEQNDALALARQLGARFPPARSGAEVFAAGSLP